jgi:hypothetical protein
MRYLVLIILTLLLTLLLLPIPASAQDTFTSIYRIQTWYDGYLSKSDAVYLTAQESSDADAVWYGGSWMRVGQATGFDVWRGFLYFDTTSLPSNAVIDSAKLHLYLNANQSATDFDLVLVEGGDLPDPPDELMYGDMYNFTTALNSTWNTSSIPGSPGTAYEIELTLNSTGEESLVREGYTKFGLRSSLDIAATQPTTNEYIDLWTSESAYGPVLEVTYSLAEMGQPDELVILTATYVYTDYIEAGDFLLVFPYKLLYEVTPYEDPEDYYDIEIHDSGGLIATYPLRQWGYRPGSCYLSADQAPSWLSSITVKIVGKEDKGLEDYTAELTLQSWQWRGGNLQGLENWCRSLAYTIGDFDEGDELYYFEEVATEGKQLNYEGSYIFQTGIPYIEQAVPNLFAYKEIPYDWQEGSGDTPGEVDEDLGDWGNLGATLTANFDTVGNLIGVDGQVIAALSFLALMAGIAGAVFLATGNVQAGLLIAAPFLFVGNYLGVISFAVTATLGVIAIVVFFHQFWIKNA